MPPGDHEREQRAPGRRRLGGVRSRLALALAAALLALVVADLASRLVDPHPEVLPPGLWEGQPAGTGVYAYVEDAVLGYRPVLDNADYSPFGTLANPHAAEKPPEVSRLLFLGDSVARKALIQRALESGCAEASIEIWTAAVEGYNTVQEVEFYLRYARRLRPDHLTLLFHNNDFLATPVVYATPNGDLKVWIGQAPLSRFDRSLLAVSNLYRHFLKRRLRWLSRRDPVTTAAETRAAIRRLQQALAEDGTELTVVLLPILAPYEQWTAREKRHREQALEIFQQLEIDHYDLLEPLTIALDAGVEMAERPGDAWHPNRRAALRFTRYLLRRGYLGSFLDRERCAI